MPASRGGGRSSFRVNSARNSEGNTKKVHQQDAKGVLLAARAAARPETAGARVSLAAEALGSAAARRDARPRHRARAAAPPRRVIRTGVRVREVGECKPNERGRVQTERKGVRVQTELLQQ